MSKVNYECDNCGNRERPMNHDNPVARCSGTFYWVGSSTVKCTDCKREYASGERFWCSQCRQWRTDYTLD